MAKKIFELAQEYDFGALDLVELLKTDGFKVRNHMAVLEGADLARAIELLTIKKGGGSSTDKSTSKKKVTKKVVRKRTVAEEEQAKLEAQESPVEDATAPAEETAQQKTVIRRKITKKKTAQETLQVEADEHEEIHEYEEEEETHLVQQQQDDTKPAFEAKSSDSAAATTNKSGLRVVSRPVRPEPTPVKQPVADVAQEVEEKTDLNKKEYLKERMHSFTPIFVPEKTVKVVEKEKPKKELAPGEEASDEFLDDDSKAAKDKKRFGDLAAMVAKPKSVGKVRDLIQIRADEELKSYVLGGAVGQIHYTPAGRKKSYSGPAKSTIITEVKDSKRNVQLHKGGTVGEIALKMNVKFEVLRDKVLDLNLLVKEDDFVGIKLAEKIAALFNYRVQNVAFQEEQILAKETKNIDANLKPRNPIITIMGHVDHGKTTLLDTIRKEKVAAGEAGGITQHIGAYSVKVKDTTITFLDTPGHAAFASMRQRGANVTDIVVLVVAADDGVMPQTKESVRFCLNAKVPIIVAVNKMDKEGANPDRVKQELMEFGLTPEDWGGETQYVEVSALKGTGVDNLLVSIALQAEIMELTANPKGAAEGIVIESKIETGRGPVCTVLIQSGTLSKGDCIVVGETSGRARSLMDFNGKDLKEAGPSTPVQILGLENPPSPGDVLHVVKNEREAKKIAENRLLDRKELESTPTKNLVSLEDFFAQEAGKEGKKILHLVIRSDVHGSYEAIKSSLESMGNDEVGVQIIAGGVGAISDSDVELAFAAKAVIIGFNMRPTTSARKIAETRGIEIKTYSIIYQLIDDIKLALEGLLEPERIEKYIGRAEVRNTFAVPKFGVIAGSAVIDGKIARGCNIRLLREGKIVFDGKLSSLKRFKDDAKEVSNGYECGIALEGFNDIRLNDIFEAYIMEEKKRTLVEAQTHLAP